MADSEALTGPQADDTITRMKAQPFRGNVSNPHASQRELLLTFLRAQGIARLAEIRRKGITAATVSRSVDSGHVTRLGRGLYQLANAPADPNRCLAAAAKRIPRGVICLTSALAFHCIADKSPCRVWVAIGPKDCKPQIDYPAVRVVRFSNKLLRDGIEVHQIEGVSVSISNVAKTVTDVFRHRRSVGIEVSIRALGEALRQGKATPAEISDYAMRGGVWSTLRPYLEAFLASG
ncbi:MULTISPECIES: type IV toxin-antitoxin system AbiEi family antitoxin domain-containing protein [unclassified Bradyrhizobium]|uniref:type IV toxin-antitoxin system AbiEi family antitoxin domain-containing protein n=1 Tax=unclassified Bradyrhizobium TaxID=2631580 RepID=UPI002916D396|nr:MULTISPECIES: type IV toxin-antitoxin system AbiEi family antitoxin domain-containing protein [unclassified Bradyrhizobium]